MRKPRIAIIGGGIGGAAAALALYRAGVDATLYERAGDLQEVGAGLNVWPNAARVLAQLGVLDDILPNSGIDTHFLVQSHTGKVLMEIEVGRFEVPALCTHRATLLAALLRPLPESCVRLGYELASIEKRSGKIHLHFKNGSVGEFDGVVGADGIRSRVREWVNYTQPRYRGYTVWRGVASLRSERLRPGYNSESWGPGQRFGILGIGNGRFSWHATLNVPLDHEDSPAGRKADLLSKFGGWHDPIPALIEAAAPAILKNPACDLPPRRRWGSGAVTLLGDAAHALTPNLGQGACMALEDAAVLAKCLVAEREVATAFPAL